jgi:hypothetical protein
MKYRPIKSASKTYRLFERRSPHEIQEHIYHEIVFIGDIKGVYYLDIKECSILHYTFALGAIF